MKSIEDHNRELRNINLNRMRECGKLIQERCTIYNPPEIPIYPDYSIMPLAYLVTFGELGEDWMSTILAEFFTWDRWN